tara:strand:+ start:1537 stop:2724 length:1188 start_codon:yes stop_codon:yes gene_type:complete
MKRIIFLVLIIFSNFIHANENELSLYKDFVIDPVSFAESDFFKSFNNTKDYKKFFNIFVNNKELKEKLIQENSIKDVLTVCYFTYIEKDKEIYNLPKKEGKYCLYGMGLSGIKEAFDYLANYHFLEYKKTLYSKNKVDVDELIKVSYYFGFNQSFDLNYEIKDSILNFDIINFEDFINDSLVKINNKDALRSYYNNSKLISIDLPINSLVLNSQYENFWINLSDNYKKSFNDEDIKVFDGIRKNNYRFLKDSLFELNGKENEYLNTIDFKDIESVYDLCSRSIFAKNDFRIKANIPEFCLSQISLNNLHSESSYDLGLYFYIVSQENTGDNKRDLINKSIMWLAFSSELNNNKAFNLFKKILVENKDNYFLEYIINFNNSRKKSKLLIDNKIKNI